MLLPHLPKMSGLLAETFAEWRKGTPSLFAAAIAYYSFFSIIPLLVIIAAIGSIFFGQAAVAGQLKSALAQLFGEKVAVVIESALVSTYNQESKIAVMLAIATIIFGGSYVFVQLRNALNIIWGVHERKKLWMEFVEGRLVSLVMITGIAALLLLWFVTSASLSTIIVLSFNGLLLEALNFLLLFLVSTIIFAMIYKLLPAVKLTWEDVALGAVFTAFLFTVGEHLVAFYLSKIGIATIYGVAGSIVVLLTWFYISAQLFLFGVMFTKVFAARHGSHKKAKT